MDPIKYSTYADECCRVLEEAHEYPSDERLVLLMRIMRMLGKIRSIFGPDEWDPSADMSVPVGVCVKSLADELGQLKPRLPTGTSFAGKFPSLAIRGRTSSHVKADTSNQTEAGPCVCLQLCAF